MACPFFEPTEVIDTGPWLHRPRLPLGETYAGVCHACVTEKKDPAELDLCNHGYARAECQHFPADRKADAVRFSITQEEPLRLVYILEKDHAPLEYGVIEAAREAPGPVLAAQARAFLASYARLSRQA